MNEEKTIFNKRLSAARSVVENAFGILASRFRVLGTTINLEQLKASIITLACCYLHNFLIRENEESYLAFSGEAMDRCTVVELERTKHRNTSTEAKNVRDQFCRYFCAEERMDATVFYSVLNIHLSIYFIITTYLYRCIYLKYILFSFRS